MNLSAGPRHSLLGWLRREMGSTRNSTLSALGCTAVLALALPRCIAYDLIPDPAVGWPQAPTASTAGVATVIVFTFCYLVEFAARHALDAAFSSHPLLSAPRHRQVLARHIMDTIALFCISGIGFSMAAELDWDALPTTPHARA